MDIVFQNVTELTLQIDRTWPIGSMERLSNILNLSNLQTVLFDFQNECKFNARLDVEMNTLFKQAWNLRSINIICNYSERMKLITFNAICLNLPRHIKYLDTEITYVDDAILILERAQHLSSITFRPAGSNMEGFMNTIKQWLLRMERYFTCELEWDTCPYHGLRIDKHLGVHFWLGKSMNKPLNKSISHKRIKRNDYYH